MRRLLRLLAFPALWWLALFGWWVLLVGTNAGLELLAGASAGALGTVLSLAFRRQALFRFRLDPALLAKAWRFPFVILRDLCVVIWALALHLAGTRPVRGAWVAVPFPSGRGGVAAGRRALAVLETNLGPNTVVADVDAERDVALVHVLESRRAPRSVP